MTLFEEDNSPKALPTVAASREKTLPFIPDCMKTLVKNKAVDLADMLFGEDKETA